MDIQGEVISNAQTEKSPLNQELQGITSFTLAKFEAACKRRDVTLEDTIAGFLALDEEDAEQAKANKVHMMRDQAKIALDIAGKYEPDKSAIKHTGDAREPVSFIIEK
jgi:hypothetical protein